VRDIKEAEESLKKAGADAARAVGAEEETRGQGIILKRVGNKIAGEYRHVCMLAAKQWPSLHAVHMLQFLCVFAIKVDLASILGCNTHESWCVWKLARQFAGCSCMLCGSNTLACRQCRG